MGVRGDVRVALRGAGESTRGAAIPRSPRRRGGVAPLYRQIVDQVRGRIRSGALPVGSRLPPTRDLARSLKTHRNTVVRAYEELAASGHTISTVGRGTFVSDPPTSRARLAPPA